MASEAHVDSVVPRGKAVFHAVLPAIAFLVEGTGAGVIVGLTGLAMLVSVLGGPKLSIIGRAFNSLIRPALKIGPGKPEAAAPHRFAELVGAVFLLASAAFYLAGATSIAGSLALIVVALATLNAAAGICVGCQMYLLFKRLGNKVAA